MRICADELVNEVRRQKLAFGYIPNELAHIERYESKRTKADTVL